MLNILPIPKILLIHSIDYYEIANDSRYRGSFKDPIRIDFVRVVFKKVLLKQETSDETISIRATLFIDATYSTPFIELKENSKVTLGTMEMFVYECSPLYSNNPEKPHHYEVLLR